jgi:hypothetical protein
VCATTSCNATAVGGRDLGPVPPWQQRLSIRALPTALCDSLLPYKASATHVPSSRAGHIHGHLQAYGTNYSSSGDISCE